MIDPVDFQTKGIVVRWFSRRVVAAIIAVLCCWSDGLAQDIHFSHYLTTPSFLNPALTGYFNGDYRLIGNYRNQWNSVTVPYKTFGFAGDMRNFIGNKRLGAGLSIYNDNTGDSDWNTIQVAAAGSYSYPLTGDSVHHLAFGLQLGVGHQSIDYSALYFDNQYTPNSGFDPSIDNGENLGQEKVTYPVLNTGVAWHYLIDGRNRITTGISVYNLTEPNYRFDFRQAGEIGKKLNVHANAEVGIRPKIDLLPGFWYSRQDKFNEFVMGTSARYLYDGFTSLHLGYWYRNRDASFVTAGVTYNNIYAGMSYDFTNSDFKTASNGRGGIEFNVIYIIRKFDKNIKRYRACPNFI